MWDGLKALGRRETWGQAIKAGGILADAGKRQAVLGQAQEGLDKVKAGEHGALLGHIVNLTAKTPIGAAANATLEAAAKGDYGGALAAARKGAGV